MDDYDAFDYVNGDFDKVRNGGARTEGSSKKKRPQQSKHNNGKLWIGLMQFEFVLF